MSLLDDVSIVVTPNGYKAGELYAVVPVPTEGAEEVTNGDFSSGTSPWALNSNWSLGGVGVIADGTSDSTIWQSGVVEDNKQYIVTYTLTDFLQGSINVDLSGGNGITRTVAGTYTEVITSGTSPTTRLSFEGGLSFKVTLSNVSVKEYTSADMDVTRATAATRVDENGLVNYAEIVSDTESITNGSFTGVANGTDVITLSGWSAYGTPTSRNVVDNKLVIVQNAANQGTRYDTGVLTGNYKFTVDVSGDTGDGSIYIGGTGLNFGINTYVGKVVYYFTASSNLTIFFRAGDNNGGDTTSYTNISIKEVTRDNVPRIDYTGGGCPHILAEPQRTNLITYSEDFSQSYWTKQSGVTPTYNTTETLSPDGTYNATKFIGNGSSGVLKGGISVTGVIARSVYLKSITGTVNVVLKDPNLTVTQKTLTVTEEWQRFELIESNGTSTQGIWIDDIPASGIYIWGAQLEEGSYATSYIPTSGSTVTRNQDIFTRDGIGSLIGQTEGTFFIELSKPVLEPDNYYLISLNNAASNSDDNSVTIGFDNNSDDFYIRLRANASSPFTDNDRASLANTFYKIAIAYKSGQSLIYIDGNPITPNSGNLSTAFTFSATLDNLSFDYNGNNSLPFYGNVRQLQVYKTALTDEQLTSLTS